MANPIDYGKLTPPQGTLFGDDVGQPNVDVTDLVQRHTEAMAQQMQRLARDTQNLSGLLAGNLSAINSVNRAYNDQLQKKEQIAGFTRDELESNIKNIDITRKLQDAEAELAKARKAGATAFAREMRNSNMMDEKGNFRLPASMGGGKTNVVSQDVMDNPEIQTELKHRMALGGGRGVANTSSFRFKELFGHLAQGNIGGAVGELFQPLGSGFTAPTGSGALRRGLAIGATALLRPAVAFGAEQALTRANNVQLDLQRTGMAGGLEGNAARMEGLRARAQGFQAGLNPFDMLSRNMAMQIALGVRSEGFKGEVASAWTDSVGDVVKDLGVDATTALESMKVAVNQLGQSTQQFRESMNNLDTVAKDTSLSVGLVTQNVQGLQLDQAAKGGIASGQAATPAASAILRGLSPAGGARLPIIGSGGLSSFIGAVQPMLAQRFLGVSPLFAFDPTVTRQLPQLLDRLADMIINMKNQVMPEASPEAWAQFVANSGIGQTYLPGMNTVDVQLFLERAGKGRLTKSVRRTIRIDTQGNAAADRAQARSASVSDRVKGFLKDIPGIGGSSHGDAAERLRQGHIAFTNSLARDLMATDLTQQQRRDILRPLWQVTPQSGATADEIRAAESQVSSRVQEVLIKLTPDASRLIAPNQIYMNSIIGMGGSQGSQRSPRSN